MKNIIKCLEAHCSRNKIGREYALDKFLDFLITFFDIEHYRGDWKDHVKTNAMVYPELMAATLEWLKVTTAEIEKGGWYDSLGTLYEMMYQSKNKASALGQFFTPQSLCGLMADVTKQQLASGDEKICDSACGSGRTLLAAYGKFKKGYYIGEDIDHMSVKMCALNLMIHGARGRVVCHDALSSPIHFDWGFEINEIRYPFPNMFYSVRRISNPKPEEEVKSENKLHPLFKPKPKPHPKPQQEQKVEDHKYKPGDQMSLF